MKNSSTASGQKLRIATTNKIYFFRAAEIVRLEAKSNYTFIFLANGAKVFTSRVLKQFALDLAPLGFLRVHRTHLINPDHVLQLRPDGNLLMTDLSVAQVSRRKRSGVNQLHAPPDPLSREGDLQIPNRKALKHPGRKEPNWILGNSH